MTIKICMFSKADSVPGQGVGSAYTELVKMLEDKYSSEFEIAINDFSASTISHYHTVNPQFYFSTFQKKKRGIKIGYVHFLPETLDGSLKLYGLSKLVFSKYVLSFYRRMDLLVVVNPDFITELVKLGFDDSKIVYIPNFVDTENFYQIQEKKDLEQFKKSLGIPVEKFVVLGVGQIQKRKGFTDFYKLSLKNPEIQFIWAGGFSFGKLTEGYEEYQKIVSNPPENLLLPGIVERSELNKFYNIADIFLLPSYAELFPMSILEAFNCGTPVMLRDLDLYKNILDGLYIQAKDFVEMDEKINAMTKCSEEKKIYQNKAFEGATRYSKENVSKIWKDFYENVGNTI